MKQKSNLPLIIIFVTLLIDCIGFGIIIPVTPRLISELIGGNISEASRYGGILTFVYASMQFLFAPVMGGLSDRFGRRPVILLSVLGLGIDYLFLYFAPTYAWLVVGRLIAGIAGASFTPASAYISDISTPEKRAQNFGMIGAAFGLGFILGPVIGGIFAQFGTRVPFLVASGFSLLNFLIALFFLPESLPADNRRKFEIGRSNPFALVTQIKRYPLISGLLLALFFIYVASHATQSTWTYFTMEKFKWSEQMVGYSLGIVGLSVAIVQGGLIRIIIPKIGKSNAVIVGLSLYILSYILYAFASSSYMMFAIIAPYALAGITMSGIQSLISIQVPNNQQGEMQGLIASIMSISSIIGPLTMTNLFTYFTNANAPVYFPGAPFLLGAALCALSLIVCLRFLRVKTA
jgi:DHA1 family tetracycline resistance protein-like MFS transporter